MFLKERLSFIREIREGKVPDIFIGTNPNGLLDISVKGGMYTIEEHETKKG